MQISETDEMPMRAPLHQAQSEIRRGFVFKVYSLLVAMLAITTSVAVPMQFMITPAWMMENVMVYNLLIFGSLFITIAMSCCCMGALRVFPTNYIFMLVFSVLYGIIVGSIAVRYTLASVALAAGVTCLIVLGLTFYACFTKTDFTGMGPFLFAALWGLIMMSFASMALSWIFPGMYSTLQTVYAGLGAILFSFYIVFDTQKILGGSHKVQFNIDDYAFAAISLYLDIINLFIYILSLLGDRK